MRIGTPSASAICPQSTTPERRYRTASFLRATRPPTTARPMASHPSRENRLAAMRRQTQPWRRFRQVGEVAPRRGIGGLGAGQATFPAGQHFVRRLLAEHGGQDGGAVPRIEERLLRIGLPEILVRAVAVRRGEQQDGPPIAALLEGGVERVEQLAVPVLHP